MALQVDGKTALVTGAGSGICLVFTKLLLSHGCNVVIADLGLRPEAELVVHREASQGAKAVFIKTDVTNWTELRAAFDFAIERFGSLDIVCPGAALFEPAWSNFWRIRDSADNETTSSFKTIDINITHPIRATQLAVDSFVRQKLGHGVVIIISSIAAQLAFLPTPMYAASKHAMSGFTRSLADLEPKLNIRVNAVAPGCVRTPLWTQDKMILFNEEADSWVTAEKVAQVMLDLIQNKENVGGTVLEVGIDKVRAVAQLNDSGPQGKGHTLTGLADGTVEVYETIAEQFGK
ncbi:hypothetical protein BP5796_12656 [Coleophoma crateriformis]|uniref:Uncharacterized protein n=1 Tax=Coleophoma crateriformis TaxID=565419 RepID=A0A3D8Q5V5_9HELO|nr:hypothetical protein BP5796_12656 [Coleophoma crateriformis]